jgi:NADH:ubiquinone oxidoreductase subunit F (NADH-binding)
VQAAETSERLAGLDVREWFTTLTAALDTDPLQVVAVVEEVAARMRGRLGIATPTTPTTPAEP